jgi:hypothetical protein
MNKFAFIAAILLTGCASTSQSARDRKTEDLLTEKIARLERQCEDQAIQKDNAVIAQITASHDTFADLEIKKLIANREQEISACQAEADREDAKISRDEVSEYQRQGEEERGRSAFMATLTASRIH